ncbi:dynein regulatory complex protein 1 isoform X2 [Centropristis striata]|uniref:dynein regulatory complex protein 1 isoform X2 n=1 Tax=Centropristis striata TaxID=184440 RepID=UPI0027E02FAB|nr:dynein regulatory complex protein 1 isoform X2 [Centropristis striata]
MSENQEAKNGVPPQEAEEDPNEENHEETCEIQPQDEEEEEEEEEEESEELITPQKMIHLLRDSTTLVTNIQTAADTKESMRRTELEEARRVRLEQLMNDAESSQEKFEEITRGWSVAKEKVIPQELQEALNSQQQLCVAIIEDKKKLINELQQELRVRDDRYVKDLRKQEEELALMMERMEDQIKTLTKAYREELAQMESIYQQANEVLLSRHRTEWEQHLNKIWDQELENLAHRRKKVEEYEVIIHNLMLETTDKFTLYQTDLNAQFQALEREKQQVKATNMITTLKKINQKNEKRQRTINLDNIKSRLVSLQTEMKKLKASHYGMRKQLTKKSQCLSEEYKRSVEQYERIQGKKKHLAVANARKFEQMWLTIDEEVKQLVDRVLVIDSQICRSLGLTWQRPPMPFMELSGPIQPQKQPEGPACRAASQQFDNGQASQWSPMRLDLSVRPKVEDNAERKDVEMYKDGTSVQSESGAEVEEGRTETLKKVMELLCDEAGYLVEDKLLNLLAPLEEEEQTLLKLASLLSTFNIEVEDVPSLAEFLLKYAHKQREQTEDVCVDSGESNKNAEEVETHLTSELIDRNQILPVLKSFLELRAS